MTWTIQRTAGSENADYYVREGGKLICEVTQQDDFRVSTETARLIAAAPELLKALQHIVSIADDEPEDIKARGASRAYRCAEFARAAIAKVTGETK